MEFKDGASIHTNDQKEAGNLQRVVINPETRQITHIVISRGILIKGDTVIPVEKVAQASQEEVALTCSHEELKELPPLEITPSVPRNADTFYNQSTGGILTTASFKPAVVSETIRTIQDHLVALKEGAMVVSSDDKHVGNIERIFTEAGKVTHITLSQGLLAKTEKSIPFDWVKIIGENEVDLGVNAQKIDDLPPV